MARVPPELARAMRERQVAVNRTKLEPWSKICNHMEQMRAYLHVALKMPPPQPYVMASEENVNLLLGDLYHLQSILICRASGIPHPLDDAEEVTLQ